MAAAPKDSSQFGQLDLRGLKILLVEDSPDNQYLMLMMLNRTGSTVEVASDGSEGVEKALKVHGNLIANCDSVVTPVICADGGNGRVTFVGSAAQTYNVADGSLLPDVVINKTVISSVTQ